MGLPVVVILGNFPKVYRCLGFAKGQGVCCAGMTLLEVLNRCPGTIQRQASYQTCLQAYARGENLVVPKARGSPGVGSSHMAMPQLHSGALPDEFSRKGRRPCRPGLHRSQY